jgi:hypothetical protein
LRRGFDVHQRGGGSHPAHTADAECRRDQRQIGNLVLPLHQPTEVDAPGLRAVAAVAQRLERNLDFERPAALETAGLHEPDAVPARVLLVVGHHHVAQRAERIGLEQVAVPAIVQRVDDEGEVLVAEDVAVVAPQLVGDLALRVAVPAARRNVQAASVEENPGVGFFGGRRSLARLLLDEIGDRLDERIDLLVQVAVNLQRRVEPHGADRDMVVRGAFDEGSN